MRIIEAKHQGFCFGVSKAVELAFAAVKEHKDKKIYTLGKLIHNETVINKLKAKNIIPVKSVDGIEPGAAVIIRSHGVGKADIDFLERNKNIIIDATCLFVKKIQDIVKDCYDAGKQVVILGEKDHPEVLGINGWCDNSAIIINSEAEVDALPFDVPLCVVAQTTYPTELYNLIVKKIKNRNSKSVELFDTICYTTNTRTFEALSIAKTADIMLVLGSAKSSNTVKLFNICGGITRAYLIENAGDIKKIKFKNTDTVGIVSGASTPKELITEVKDLMADFNNEVQSTEFLEALQESHVSLREGKRIKGTVIAADDKGISVNIGQKKDGFIEPEEAGLEEYNPADYVKGSPIEAVIVSTNSSESGCIMLSKKRVDEIKKGDEQVELIRDGEPFEIKIEKDTKGGLLSKLGTYSVFIPASLVNTTFVKDLTKFVNKTLRVVAVEIDDAKHKIVASARKPLEDEKRAREEVFWNNVTKDVILSGKVKHIGKDKQGREFGAFVSVDGFDCLVPIGEISWNHIKKVEDVLKIGETYDFLVLSTDKDKNRVSLSYKQLQQHPFKTCADNHPIGSVFKGKVTGLMPFGAFVAIENGIEGLVHVSEAAHTFVKSISEVVKVGDEVDVMVMNIDDNAKKITLSMKACKPDEGVAAGEDEKREPNPKAKKKSAKGKTDTEESAEWSEEASNNLFAELLKDIKPDPDKD